VDDGTTYHGGGGSSTLATASRYVAKLYRSRRGGVVVPAASSSSFSSSSSSSVVDRVVDRRVLLLAVTLPAPSSSYPPRGGIAKNEPSATLSVDANSVSLRVRFPNSSPNDGEDMADALLDDGGDTSSYLSSPRASTSPSALDLLRCRSCQNRIVGGLPSPPSSGGPFDAGGDVFNVAAAGNDDNRPPPLPSSSTTVIKSVLPLPSGYWDDISDYLICYDGQPAVDFTSSATSAMPHTAFEDDAVLVLHVGDLSAGGVCVLDRVWGYGENSSSSERRRGNNDAADNDDNEDASSRAWRDMAASRGEEANGTVTCANCCSTLGYVSDRDSDTYRLYKHLLDCGGPDDIGGRRRDAGGGRRRRPATSSSSASSSFADHTCGSFLAREMVRYAESDAVFAFVVGLSDENDRTKTGAHTGECILLRILSWDTPMSTVGGAIDDDAGGGGYDDDDDDDDSRRALCFRRVVKVIFEEASDEHVLRRTSAAGGGDGSMEWTWRGTDFCCPPPPPSSTASPNGGVGPGHAGSPSASEGGGSSSRAKASAIRIFFSKREWSELRETLIRGSHYFSEAVRDAVVTTKLGSAPGDREGQNASLSFLPLV
jgi:hypothetical protein